MERARATWTDERLDDFARRVEAGLNRVDEDLRSLRTELGARIDAQGGELGTRIDAQGEGLGTRIDAQGRALGVRIDAHGAELGARIDAHGAEFGARIDALQRTMLQIGGGILAANLVAIVSLIATQT